MQTKVHCGEPMALTTGTGDMKPGSWWCESCGVVEPYEEHALRGEDYPVLAELWDNPEDAEAFDDD